MNSIGLASAPSAASNAVVPTAPGPALLSSVPVDGATAFGVTDNLTVTFNKAVTSSNFTAATTLRNNATLANVASVVTYDAATRTLTVNPNADLTAGASYTLTLSGAGATGIRDLGGNALPTTIITFNATADGTAPTVISMKPVDGATEVGLHSNIVANFSEQVQGVSTTTAFLTNQRTGVRVTTVLVVNNAGTRVRLNPSANLARNTVYRLTLRGGNTAIRDVAGNALATFTTHFRTRP